MPVGKPSKYTPERVAAILQAIRDGNTLECAAALGGIKHTAFYEWQKRHAEFADAVEKAEADAEAEMVSRVRVAAMDPRSWTAAMTWLERRRHKDWGKKQPDTQVTHNYFGAEDHLDEGKR